METHKVKIIPLGCNKIEDSYGQKFSALLNPHVKYEKLSSTSVLSAPPIFAIYRLNGYAVSALCISDCTSQETRYPISDQAI